MLNLRNILVPVLTIAALAAVWHANSPAQENSSAGVVTVFDHAKLDASFTKALSNGGSALLWSRTSGKGTYNIDVHSRESVKAACKPGGCSHKDYTAVVYVVSGAADLVVGGKVKASGAEKFGGQFIQGGQTHRIGKGDVFIMPPDTIHWYKNVESPFRYLEVPVP